MNKKDLISRLESIGIDLEYKINQATDQICKEEWKKDLTALNETVTILKDDLDIFDVARWSRSDIGMVMKNHELDLTEEEKEVFIDDVIFTLSDRFDASIGVNWDVLEYVVEDMVNDFKSNIGA